MSEMLRFSDDGQRLFVKSTSDILDISVFEKNIHFQQLSIAECPCICRITSERGNNTIFPSSVCVWRLRAGVDEDQYSPEVLTKAMRFSPRPSKFDLEEDQGDVNKIIDLDVGRDCLQMRKVRREFVQVRYFDLSRNGRFVLLVAMKWFGTWDLENDTFSWKSIDTQFTRSFSYPKISAISANGSFVALTAEDGQAQIWDMRDGGYIAKSLQEGNAAVVSIAFSQDSSHVAVRSRDASIRIWCTATASQIGEPLYSHRSTFVCISFSRDDRYLRSGSADGTVYYWDLHKDPFAGMKPPRHERRVSCIVFSANDRYVISGSEDCTIRIWDIEGNSLLRLPLMGQDNPVRCIAMGDDDRVLVSGSDDGAIRIWDVDKGSLIGKPLQAHQSSVTSIDCTSTDGCIVSGSACGTVQISDVSCRIVGKLSSTYDKWPITQVAINKTGSCIALTIDKFKIQVYEIKYEQVVGQLLLNHTDCVQRVAFSNVDPGVLFVALNGTLRIWNFENGTDLGSGLKLDRLHFSDRYTDLILKQITCTNNERDAVHCSCPQELHLEVSSFLQKIGHVMQQSFWCSCGDDVPACTGALGTGSDRFSHLSADENCVYVDNHQLIDKNTFNGTVSVIAVHGRFTAHGFHDGMVLICRVER